ncbi:MAG: ATP phosphoribosyltransferase regulatory subunit [Eubacteriales bacterium]|nr:ATP phosphoribosyltransferase regulatory subunit [Eubacteriales bacterium]
MAQPVYGLQEKLVFSLRALYERYGYLQYKMNKFEEYDLYARNKDFLISEGIITFTDANGKLMALKPDVTLSIVKNTRDRQGVVDKLCYNENVYRAARGSSAFREIMQVGLESIGDLSEYDLLEAILLAAKSLREISPHAILDISHVGLLTALFDAIGLEQGRRREVIACIGEKNRHELARICLSCDVAEEDVAALCGLIGISGRVGETLGKALELLQRYVDEELLEEFSRIMNALNETELADMIHIDFSVVNDENYYNGLVFKGFIESLPDSVLSGGQYDLLLQKMGRSSRAIGFAVYMDALERLGEEQGEYDVDAVLLYGAGDSLAQVRAAADAIANSGRSVRALRRMPEGLRCREVIDMAKGAEK